MRIAILGAQESGVGAAMLACKLGIDAFVSDAGPIKPQYLAKLRALGTEVEQGGHTASRVLEADVVIKSPGIPESSPLVQRLLAEGKEVISEIEFASRHTSSPIVAITGSNGKTTTTLLTHHMLQKAGLDAGLCGNVGKSFAALLAERKHAYYVVEVSSFQLDGVTHFKPYVAVLLNITPDHLDRYQYRMERYVASKFRISLNQSASDHFVYCADDSTIAEGLKQHPVRAQRWPFSIQRTMPQGGSLEQDHLIVNTNQHSFTMSIAELALQGKHNTYNSLAASIAARIMEIRSDVVRESLADFQNVEHRLERVATVNGVEFINDSKATNVNSTWYALECMDKPVIWIAGGTDKGNDYASLRELVRNKVKAIVCLGKDNAKLHEAFGDLVAQMVDVTSADAAVQTAYELAQPGHVALLSPACASFDLFENYEDRGRRFKMAVKAL
jgi:UDP-N-acetylmuramoylalanine--D-glutamate ligase